MAKRKKPKTVSKILYLIITFMFFVVFNFYMTETLMNNILSGFHLPENTILTLCYVKNTGAAFSLLKDYPQLLVVLSLSAIILLFSYTIKKINNIPMKAIFWISLLMSGIFCNLYERISLGYVRDFIALNFVEFPIFNISDIFINIGVVAIVIILLNKNILQKL